MKKIGLIGGTGPESTLVYYREIEYGVQNKLGYAYFPPLTIESMSVFDVLSFCNKQDYDGLTNYLLNGIQNLSRAGVQYAALTGITPHIVFNQLKAQSPIPLVSMLETACSFSKKSGYKKVGLLGTLPTMNGTFFQETFNKQDIEVITPLEKEKQFIASKIETELEYGKVVDSTQAKLLEIIHRMKTEEHIEAVVLGCTELPLILNESNATLPYIDVMKIHIDALIDLIISNS